MEEQAQAIANLTHHQEITDAMLNTMGECMAVQQALLHIPPYDGKNMPLKTFLQDVENGYNICPEGIRDAFFKGVVAKLRDTARDAVSGIEVTTVNNLRDALKEYFAPKKDYTAYCAEIQGVRMRRDETVMEYYGRIKKIIECAKASLRESFREPEVAHTETMLNGIALESFKRGLSDDLLYAVSVQAPPTLTEAVRIARRIEQDMSGYQDRRGRVTIISRSERDPSPWRNRNQDDRRNPGYERGRSPQRQVQPFYQRSSSYDRNSMPKYTFNRDTYGNESRPYQHNNAQHFNTNHRTNQRTNMPQQEISNFPAYVPPQQPYQVHNPYFYPMDIPYVNPMPYPPYYPMMPQQFVPPAPQAQPRILQQPQQRADLNAQPAHRLDAAMSKQAQEHPATVKFITASALQKTAEQKLQ